ncbi:MAG: hypothetical protein ACKOCI_00930 [Cyanobium sp.]
MPLLPARLPLRRRRRPPASPRCAGWGKPTGALALLLALQGCSAPRQTLHLLMVPPTQLAWQQFDVRSPVLAGPLLEEFKRLHPNVTVAITLVPELEVEALLRRRRSQGLSPDLVLLRAPMANALLREGLVDPLPEGTHGRTIRSLLAPETLHRIDTRRGLSGMPVFSQLSISAREGLIGVAAAGAAGHQRPGRGSPHRASRW